MATYFMDPVSGNNANDGLSFANRKRTFNSVTTAASLGDTIRVIASPDAASVGSATWTDNSKTIAWTNNSNLKVDGCDSGWTGVTNVTVSHPTDNLEKTGTSWLAMSIAAAFTTGKAAYKTLAAPLTVSAFQQIAFYFRVNSTSTTINFKVALCSDTTGDTIVAELNKTLTYPTDFLFSDSWIKLTLDYGSAFPGTAINSIAIYLNADPSASARVFGFDGFALCKAPGASDLIDLNSLIGKNTPGEPEWYPVTDLSGAGLEIAGNQRVSALECRPYRGTTESVTTYIRNPLVLAAPWDDTDAAIKDNQITIDGGWNRTDMSTRTGETWLSGDFKYTGINGDTVFRSDVNITNIGFAHCTTGALNLTVGDGALTVASLYDFLGFIACETPVTFVATGAASGWALRNAGYFRFKCRQVWCSHVTMPTPSRPGEYTVGRIHGHLYDDGSNAAWTPGATFEFNAPTYTIGKVDNNKYGITLASANAGLKLGGTVIENNTNNFRHSSSSNPLNEYNLHFDGMADLMLDAQFYNLSLATNMEKHPSVVRQTRIGGDPNKHRTAISGNLYFESSQTVRHTASGYSWRLFAPMEESFYFYRPAGIPAFPLAQVAVEANKLVTVTCWLYVEFDPYTTAWGTGAFPHGIWGIMIQPDSFMGLSRVQVEGDMTIVAAWQQVTMTFTPSQSGVVPIYAYAYGTDDQEWMTPPAFYSAYFDDLAVTQEA